MISDQEEIKQLKLLATIKHGARLMSHRHATSNFNGGQWSILILRSSEWRRFTEFYHTELEAWNRILEMN